ncbi:MAG: ArsR/SmtB family transcription factor [Streptomyces sp.]
MLRVHFTSGDLARTRIADGPDPLWESVLSLHRMQERRPDSVPADWRKHVAQQAAEPLRLLIPLVPARGYCPDFLTAAGAAEGFEAGLDALLSTPRSQLRSEIGRLGANGPLDPWTRSVGEGAAPALSRLGTALRDYQRIALGATWHRLRARIEADRAQLARTQWYRGTEAMLRTFGHGIRWRPPVLECEYPVDRDLQLEGRGLLVIPSYFCRRTPVALADTSLPPTLVYPATTTHSTGPTASLADNADTAHLARLLGHTRTAVLQSVGGDCTTSELARRAGVSLSSASEHASVLRGAGLISSSRRRNAVHHAITAVGLALLDGRHHGPVAA